MTSQIQIYLRHSVCAMLLLIGAVSLVSSAQAQTTCFDFESGSLDGFRAENGTIQIVNTAFSGQYGLQMQHSGGDFHNFFPEDLAIHFGEITVHGRTNSSTANLDLSFFDGDSAWNTGRGIRFSLRPDNGDDPGIIVRGAEDQLLAQTGASGFNVGEWIEIAISVHEDLTTLSINGQQKLQIATPTDLVSGRLKLGAVDLGHYDDLCYTPISDIDYDPNADVVAHYTFDGSAVDVSGFGQHGTVAGASLIPDRLGRSNHAYSFDGDDFIEVASTENITFDGPFTITAWSRVDAFATGQSIEQHPLVSKLGGDGWSGGYGLMAVEELDVPLFMAASRLGGQNSSVNSGEAAETDRWYHVVALYDGTGMSIYVDGIPKSLNPFTRAGAPDQSQNPLVFGRSSGSSLNWYQGDLDDVRLYDRALTANEINWLHARESGVMLNAGSATCSPGEPVLIPVLTSDVSLASFAGYTLSVSYDQNIILLDNVSTSGTMSSAMITQVDNPQAGVLTIAAAGAEDLAGSGTLLYLAGTCQSARGQSSAVTIQDVSTDSKGLIAATTDGQVMVTGFGDASDDGTVDISDAVEILRLVVGMIPEASCPECADVSGNGTTDIVDAVLVLRYINGVLSCFPAESGCSGEPFFDPNVSQPSFAVNGTDTGLRIEIDPANAQSVYYEMESDGDAVIQFDGLNELRSQGWYVEETAVEGKTTIAILAPSSITEPIQLDAFITSGDTTESGLRNLMITEGGRTDISGVGTERPTDYELTVDVYPNPVRTEATIEITTRTRSRLSIELYDVLGRRIRTIANGPVSAGSRAFSLESQGLPAGLYRVVVHSDGRTVSHSFVLTK